MVEANVADGYCIETEQTMICPACGDDDLTCYYSDGHEVHLHTCSACDYEDMIIDHNA
jgi:Zn ribbon nucleic-acid-binding protein